jgi:protein-disulfide isomerase
MKNLQASVIGSPEFFTRSEKNVLSRRTQALLALLTKITKDCAASEVSIRKLFSAGSERGLNNTDHQKTAEKSGYQQNLYYRRAMPKNPLQTLGKIQPHPHNRNWRLRGWKMTFFLFSILLLAPSSIGAQTPDQTSKPASPSDKKPPLAEVNGKAVTSEEVEGSLGTRLAQLEEQIYQLQRQRLESLIAERLLTNEAARRGVTTQALIDTEITSKAVSVPPEDVEKFYQANKAQIGGALDANLRARITGFLQNQRLDSRREEFLQTLRSQSKVIINLPTPQFRLKVSTDGAPFRGGAQAPVTIIEYSDFHCPFCGKVQTTLSQVLALYGDKVKLVYRHLPIDQLHPQARRAAEAASCANEQGKFWEYHDQLYTAGTDTSQEKLKSLAQTAGLDVVAFESCLNAGKHQQAIQKEIEEAARIGLNATPSFLINGRFFSGAQPFEAFVRVIEEELGRTGSDKRRESKDAK